MSIMDPSNCAKIPTSIFSDYNKFMNYLKVFCLFMSKPRGKRIKNDKHRKLTEAVPLVVSLWVRTESTLRERQMS